MRYLIIDMESYETLCHDSHARLIEVSNCILSEEETMDKFKECWDDGYDKGYSGKWFSKEEYWEKYLKQG